MKNPTKAQVQVVKGVGRIAGKNFTDGVQLIYEDLNMSYSHYELDWWANDNPEIWGNESGRNMFASSGAYCSIARPYGAESLQHVIDHWTEVQSRLPI